MPLFRQPTVWSRRLSMAMLLAPALCLAGPLKLAVSRTPLSLPLYVAQSQGFFAAQGLDVKVEDCIGGHRCLAQLFDGKADVATAADTPLMFNGFKRQDFAVIGTFVTSADDIKLVASPSSGITTPMHLGGKKVGIVWGTSSHYFMDAFLLFYGIDPKSVTMVKLQPEDMAAAVASQAVDAVAIWEPYAHAVLKARRDAVAIPHARIYMESFNLIVSRPPKGSSDAGLVALLKAVDKAEAFIAANPAQAKQILQRTLSVDAAFVDWVWPQLTFKLSLQQGLLKSLESQARWAIREGHVEADAVPNYLSIFHPAPLSQAVPQAVSIIP